ncbi:MAG: DUF4245 domain-containing protein, partial [Rhodoglobus sp.]|nr:DUF4245 domain-containing protein [Rhodoglobus sp.]
ARKAESSRRHRSSQTAVNLVIATLASLLIVLFLVAVVVRPTPEPAPAIDYASIASQAQPLAAEPLVVPSLDAAWVANSARFDIRNEVPTWYVGFITPGRQFIALNQGIGGNPSWLSTLLNGAPQTGSVTVEGVRWAVYDQRDRSDAGNFAYSLATTVGGSTIVLNGTAADDEFLLLATSIAAELESP